MKISKHCFDRILERDIKEDWIHLTINEPNYIIYKNINETIYFKQIKEKDNRCLKVVINPIKKLIITVYFDRNMTKKGCQDENKIR